MEPLPKGQKIVLNQVKLSGTLDGLHHTDSADDSEDENAIYRVHFPERSFWVRRADFTAYVEPEPDKKLRRGSREWAAEWERFSTLVPKAAANPQDRVLAKQFIESAERLGFIVPTESE